MTTWNVTCDCPSDVSAMTSEVIYESQRSFDGPGGVVARRRVHEAGICGHALDGRHFGDLRYERDEHRQHDDAGQQHHGLDIGRDDESGWVDDQPRRLDDTAGWH